MKRTLAAVAVCLFFVIGAAFADKARDIRDLVDVHTDIVNAIHSMERARAANHYDMAGHGVKAEEHLRAAEHELQMAIDAAKR